MDVISLAQKLISFNTINPPGNEAVMAEFTGRILACKGFEVRYIDFEPGRKHLIAEKGVTASCWPIVFSGHFDTVPLGASNWEYDPFVGEVVGDRIYGRGSSDMKSALAAMIVAAIEIPEEQMPKDGIRFILTAAEELGCKGIQQLAQSHKLPGNAGAVIVGEPTGNVPAIAHKGAIYLNAIALGKTAHSSMPELGDNAIYKAARAINKIEKLQIEAEEDLLLGYPSINVGKIEGGLNLNSVPDRAEFTIDIRTTPSVDHKDIIQKLGIILGDEIKLEKLVDLQPVYTSEKDHFVKLIYEICREEDVRAKLPLALTYLTDASVLQKYYGNVATIILGPGEQGMAHQTDEYCYISNIHKAVSIYKNVILNWRNIR